MEVGLQYEPPLYVKSVNKPVVSHFLRFILLLSSKRWLSAVVFVLLFCWRLGFLSMEAELRFLQIQWASPPSEVQLFYDQGYGFNPHDSVVATTSHPQEHLLGIIPLSDHLAEWIGGQPVGTFRFQLTPEKILSFRIQHIGDSPAVPQQILLVDGLGLVLQRVEPLLMEQKGGILGTDASSKTSMLSVVLEQPLMTKLKAVNVRDIPIFRIMAEGVSLLICVVMFLLFSTVLRPCWQVFSTLRNDPRTKAALDWFVLLALTSLYFWGYRKLNDHLFPLLFWKVHLVALILLSIYYVRRYLSFLQDNLVVIFFIYYALIVTTSALLHFAALFLDDSVDVLALNNGLFHGELINRWKQLTAIFDIVSNSDQTLFLYIFPLLLFIAFGLFAGVSFKPWKKFLALPLLAAPNLLVAWFSRNNLAADPSNGATFFLQQIGDIRFLCFFLPPLCILSFMAVKNLFFRVLYLLLAVISGWVCLALYGRGPILGLLVFLMALPFVKIWVHRDTLSGHRVFLTAGGTGLVAVLLLFAFVFPQCHGALNKVFPQTTVQTGRAIIVGVFNSKEDPDPIRSEMNRQAIRLIKAAPFGGWGPGGFPTNVDRMRVQHGEGNGVSHSITSLYQRIATSYGLPGLLVFLFILLLPFWMVWQTKKQEQGVQARWALGIVWVVLCIMFLLFKTNSFLGLLEISWLYSLLLGYLFSVAYRNGGCRITGIKRQFGISVGGICVILVMGGSYLTSLGNLGYAATARQLTNTIVGGYTVASEKKVFDSQTISPAQMVTSRLVTTMATPWRLAYTTSEYLVDYGQLLLPEMDANGLYLLKLQADKSAEDYLFLWADVYVDGVRVDAFSFQREGTKYLYYQLPGKESKKVAVHLRVRWAMPYHKDMRQEIVAWPHMATHPEFQHLSLQLHVIKYVKERVEEKT